MKEEGEDRTSVIGETISKVEHICNCSLRRKGGIGGQKKQFFK